MHNCLRTEKLHWRYQEPLPATAFPSKWSYSIVSMYLDVSCHTFKERKHGQPAGSPQNFHGFVPATQHLYQYIKHHHQWSGFLQLLSVHKPHRHHIQILPAQLLSPKFSQLCYYLASSLACMKLWVLTYVLHCRAWSPVTLQKQSMSDQNAYNNTDFPWLQFMPQQCSSWVIWQRQCSVKKTFLNLGTVNSPDT